MSTPQDVLCPGTNLNGSRCTRHRKQGMASCLWHDPAQAEERARKLEQQAALVRSTAVTA